ncbi:metallophosphoesterase [Staphylococcus massiliensis]|uniref:metallophosphoesterase n=1 Tax=Staphylococcus massiliensis TaxID=555791 RepID=UPI00370D85E2
MNIGIISDLHIDRNKDVTPSEYEAMLVDIIKHSEIDLFIIAGDISNHHAYSYEFVQRVQYQTAVQTLLVPGNHDLWDMDAEAPDTTSILNYFKSKPKCLIDEPFIINDEWAIVGHCGWYNYAFASDQFDLDRLSRKKFLGATWQDKKHIDWHESDIEVSRQFAKDIERDIKRVGDRKVILITHMVTHPDFVVPLPHRIFDYFNAFLGTTDIDDLYDTYNIPYSVMGHVHFRKRLQSPARTYICPCLGYPREWRTPDIKKEMIDAIQMIQI